MAFSGDDDMVRRFDTLRPALRKHAYVIYRFPLIVKIENVQ